MSELVLDGETSNVTSEELAALKLKAKEIKKFERAVRTLNQTQMWRYVADTMFRLNPSAKFERDEILKSIELVRAEQATRAASSKTKAIRYGLRMPTTLLEALRLADPQIGLIIDSKNVQEQNQLVRKFMKTFPEYRIPREI